MLYSMTGYSTLSVDLPSQQGPPIGLVIELKSLNSRFFEVTMRLPGSLSSLETDLLSQLKKLLLRGRGFLTVQVTSKNQDLETVVPAISLAQSYVSGLKEIAQATGIESEITFSDLIALPDLFYSERAPITDAMRKVLFQAIEMAASNLMKVRLVEGAHLAKDIEGRFVSCEKSIEEITRVHATLMERQKKLVLDAQHKADNGDDEARAKLDELYPMLNKLDVAEEITRFGSHLASAKNLFGSDEIEKGKRFDFTLQELLRETNTIAAKCSNYEISSLAVDIKVELEKAREQVQNVL